MLCMCNPVMMAQTKALHAFSGQFCQQTTLFTLNPPTTCKRHPVTAAQHTSGSCHRTGRPRSTQHHLTQPLSLCGLRLHGAADDTVEDAQGSCLL